MISVQLNFINSKSWGWILFCTCRTLR